MDKYPSNSHKATEKKKVQSVVKHEVTKVKKSRTDKVLDTIFKKDLSEIKDEVIFDMLIPELKDCILCTVSILLYGDDAGARGYKSRKNGPVYKYNESNVSYDDYYQRKKKTPPGYSGLKDFQFDTYVFEDRGDAEQVLAIMDEQIDIYDVVSVADFFSAMNVQCDYTYANYGWTNLKNARIMHGTSGWFIKLPKPVSIR